MLINDLKVALDDFMDAIEAHTVPTADGGREVGLGDSIALSGLAATLTAMVVQSSMSLQEGKGTVVKADEGSGVSLHRYTLGGEDGIDPVVYSALLKLTFFLAHPDQKRKHRFVPGDIVSAQQLASLTSAHRTLARHLWGRSTAKEPRPAPLEGLDPTHLAILHVFYERGQGFHIRRAAIQEAVEHGVRNNDPRFRGVVTSLRSVGEHCRELRHRGLLGSDGRGEFITSDGVRALGAELA